MTESIKKGYDRVLLKELTKYISQEIKDGKKLKDVKKELLDAGHKQNAVEHALKDLEKNNYKDVKKKGIKDPEKKLLGALETFIHDQTKLNKSMSSIKKVLKDYGHSEELIEKAIQRFKSKKSTPKKRYTLPTTKKLIREHIMLVSLVSLILVVTISASTLNENIFLVFLGFLPSFAATLLVYYNIEKLKDKVFLIPVALATAFFLLGLISPTIKSMEYESLTIINLVLSLIITGAYKEIVEIKTGSEKNHAAPQ